MWLKKLFGKKDAPSAIDPMSERVAQSLAKLFEAHGIECGRQDEWVTPNWELPAIRGDWSAREDSGRLDLQVLVRDGLTIVESFGGVGRLDEGFDSAMRNFQTSSLHVLLSALWNHDDPEQVGTERWDIGSTPFTAVIGNLGMRSSLATLPPPPKGLFNKLHEAMREQPLTPDLHWFRFHVASIRGDLTFESLRDNEPWQPGVEALQSLAWEPTDGFYSARLFLILKPGTSSAA